MAFEIPTVFRQANHLQITSQILQSHRLHPELNEHLLFFECKVANGSSLPTPLPFGVFAEINNQGNAHESTLSVWVANGYYDNAVKFREQRADLTRINKYICKGYSITQVVPTNSAVLEGNNVWESNVQPLDEVHSVRRTVYVTTTNVITRGEFDQQLGVEHTITEELVAANVAEADTAHFPSGTTQVGATAVWLFVTYEELTCGWYLKVTENMNTGDGLILYGSRNHFWPAVLQSGPNAGDLVGEFKNEGDSRYGDEYTAAVLIDIRLKESYSGPCKATRTIGWSDSARAAPVTPTQYVTDSFHNAGIFSKFTVPTCLHYPVTWNELVGSNHPVLKDLQIRNAFFPGTTKTDWDATATLYPDDKPYKGGYLTETIVVYAPA